VVQENPLHYLLEISSARSSIAVSHRAPDLGDTAVHWCASRRTGVAANGYGTFGSTCADLAHVQILHTSHNGRFDEPQIFSNQGFRRATCRIVSSCLRTMPSGRALCKRRISENNHSRFAGSMSR
jgi:hypothetical protein